MKRQLLLVAGVFAVSGLMLVAGLGNSASAGRAVPTAGPSLLTFDDPAGDAVGAPDITKVAVSGDQSTGVITASVTATGFAPATADGSWRFVDVWFDTDRNGSTGNSGGFEYDIFAYYYPSDGNVYWYFTRWDGSEWVEAPVSTTTGMRSSGDVLTWTLSTTDLGGATSMVLYASSITIDASDNVVGRDRAPDSHSWVYDIAGPANSITKFVTPVIGQPTITPAKVVAGKRVTLTYRVTRTDAAQPKPLAGGTMDCRPTVGGRMLAHAESFKNGVARLSFVIPKTSKGKILKVKVTIKAPSYRGEDGVSISLATGQMALVATWYDGQSSTRITSLRIK